MAAFRLRPLTLALTALASAFVCRPGYAQAADDARARADALFREGQQLLSTGNLTAACQRLEESQQIDPRLGRLLNVAYCHAQAGRFASAFAEYNSAAALAAQSRQAEREQFARAQASALVRKLSFLGLDLEAAQDVAEVTVDGAPLARDGWSTPVPVDPGSHTVTFSAAGRKTQEYTIAVSEAGTTRVRVDPFEPEQAASGSVAEGPERTAGVRETGEDRTLGWIAGGAGIVALGVGTGFALNAASLKSEADPFCPHHQCDARGSSLIESAKTAAVIADIGLALGVVGVGAGAWLLLRPLSATGPSVALAGLW